MGQFLLFSTVPPTLCVRCLAFFSLLSRSRFCSSWRLGGAVGRVVEGLDSAFCLFFAIPGLLCGCWAFLRWSCCGLLGVFLWDLGGRKAGWGCRGAGSECGSLGFVPLSSQQELVASFEELKLLLQLNGGFLHPAQRNHTTFSALWRYWSRTASDLCWLKLSRCSF